VRGYKEEGTTTTPFDMTVLNKLAEHRAYVVERGEDMPQIRDWRWNAPKATRK
jgi:xylulose-5-phosphate/fructose-6-phosphate phosphoketolase